MFGGTPPGWEQPGIRKALERLWPHLQGAPRLAGRHVLLAGATGFFGSWLLALFDGLAGNGIALEVTALSRDPEAFLRRAPHYRQRPWLHWIKGDVRQVAFAPTARFDYLIQAATDTAAAAQADGLQLFDTILEGTRTLLEALAPRGLHRVLLVGSGAQYGTPAALLPIAENHTGACDSRLPASAYGEAKRAQETLAALLGLRHGFEVVFARCFAFVGPGLRLDGHFAIGNLVRDALWREALVLNSAGQAVRSYLYAADLAVWLLELLSRGEAGQAYNVGSDRAVTIAELAQCVGARLAPEKPVRLGEGGVPSYYVPDIARARGLGLDVWTSLEQAIEDTACWSALVQP